MDKPIVISLGGSLIVQDKINVQFINDFILTIKDYVAKGSRFVIITGGGLIARDYFTAIKEIAEPSNTDLDWIGIAATRLNSELLRVAFNELAYEKVVLNPDIMPTTDKPIIMSAGWQPGNSSDMAAVHCAKSVNAQKVINLSNIDYAYDKDPKKYPDAQPIKEITWTDFRKLLPDEWNPGLNAPFDPIAAKKAEELGLEVVIMNGKNLDNLKNYLDGSDFIGTKIK